MFALSCKIQFGGGSRCEVSEPGVSKNQTKFNDQRPPVTRCCQTKDLQLQQGVPKSVPCANWNNSRNTYCIEKLYFEKADAYRKNVLTTLIQIEQLL